jgi:hypothetical protein
MKKLILMPLMAVMLLFVMSCSKENENVQSGKSVTPPAVIKTDYSVSYLGCDYYSGAWKSIVVTCTSGYVDVQATNATPSYNYRIYAPNSQRFTRTNLNLNMSINVCWPSSGGYYSLTPYW